MALEGTLRDFSLADIFQLIGLQRKTGVLTLRTKDDTVTVTFLDGKVVGADSLNHRLENRLGSVLIKSAIITPEQRLASRHDGAAKSDGDNADDAGIEASAAAESYSI